MAAAANTRGRELRVVVLLGLACMLWASVASADWPAPLQHKLELLQPRVNGWLAAGGAPNAVIPLTRELDALLKTGTPDQIDAQIDRILAVVATPPAPSRSPIINRLSGLQDRINAWLRAGGDPDQVLPLGRQLDELLKTGTADAVEAQVDRIEALVSSTPAPRPSSSGTKLSGLQEQIDDWLAAGGDAAEVQPLGQKLDELLDTGTPEQIDAQIDRIRAVISTPPARAQQVAAERAAGATPVHVHLRPIPTHAAIIFWSTRYDPHHQGPTLGPSELYTMRADGSDVSQITFDHPQMYEHAAVSFDHMTVAADRYLGRGNGPTGLWALNTATQTESRLVPDFFSAGNGGVDWSPDGFIYFGGRRTPREKEGIFRIRPDGGALTQVVMLDRTDPGFVGDVSVSEDGALLAYVRAVPVSNGRRQVLKTQVWVSRTDGSGQRMVDDGGPETGNYGGFPIGDFDPEISPDNAGVVFSRTNPHFMNFETSLHTAHDLWTTALDGSGTARRLTEPGPISIIPDWHNDKILYTEYDERGNYVGLVSMRPDGSGKQRLERGLPQLWDGGRHGKWIPG